MIAYFSGTGNSEYAAQWIAGICEDDCLNLFDKLRTHEAAALSSEKPWVIVIPTYAWRIPRIVEKWLIETKLLGSKKIYFIMTCGGTIGNASAWVKKLCINKGLELLGCAEVVMPENYIALFSAPDKAQAIQIIEAAQPKLTQIAEKSKTANRLKRSRQL